MITVQCRSHPHHPPLLAVGAREPDGSVSWSSAELVEGGWEDRPVEGGDGSVVFVCPVHGRRQLDAGQVAKALLKLERTGSARLFA